ncbi:hypothetical protein DENSPDRAFT_872334 [Dentipellis sp. KUC8613]|nr:hypothetical protein DENSPDRAFT_872334 [Dentipellis sp. KUC8613]
MSPSPSIHADGKSSNSTKHEEDHGTPADTPQKPRSSFRGYVPDWVATNVQSKKSWKMVFKCWLATWAALILLLPHASLQVMGNAAFFSLLCAFFLPPSIPLQLYMIMSSTLLLGLLLGWGIGSAGMRGALAARNQAVLKETLQKAQESLAGLSNPDQVFKIEIFQGMFLDARSSVVYGVFMGFGSFIFALIRAYSPPLMFLSIFGTISLDIVCTVGPLFPFPQYTLPYTLLISSSMYFAIALFVLVTVFPETLNHAYLNGVSGLLTHARAILVMQNDVLSSTPDDFGPGCPKRERLMQHRTAMVRTYQMFSQQTKFLNGEFSYGRWNGQDVKELEVPLIAVVSRINGLLSFARYAGRYAFTGPDSGDASTVSLTTVATKASTAPNPTSDTYLMQHLRNTQHTREVEHGLRVEDVMPNIKAATAELRDACVAGLAAAQATLDFVNHTRWARAASTAAAATAHDADLDTATDALRAALEAFRTTGRKQLMAPYAAVLAGATDAKAQAALPLRGLYVSHVFGASMIVTAEVVLALVERIQATAARRKKSRLWAPKGLRTIAAALAGRHASGAGEQDGLFGEQEQMGDVFWQEEDRRAYRRDPDSEPPSNAVQLVADKVHDLLQWAKTPEAIFCFRYMILSVLLWLPCVLSNSAHFYYVNKGVWALIMAQTILNIYAGDQLYNYFVRILGTFLGLVYALMVWYIGSGSGNGNPYGLAASFGVFSIPLVFIRLYAPPQYLQGIVLGTATVALILGYSWIDGHLPVISNPGTGWHVAWRRAVLVLIGCGAAFVLMMLPPQSGRKAVRIRNAKTIDGLSHVYAALMSAWITDPLADATGVEREKGRGVSMIDARWAKGFRERLVGVGGQLQSLSAFTDLARWEGGIRGKWNYKDYKRMVEVQLEMVACLSSLGSALWKLDSGWRQSFLHHTKVVNPNFIMDVLAMFSLVSQSLRNGEPMHTVLPQNLLDRLFYHHSPVYLRPDPDTMGVIDTADMESLEHMYYSTAVIAVFQLMSNLNELHMITRKLCGQVPFQGFDKWRDEHQRAHAPV